MNNTEIVYCNYVPVSLSEEELENLNRRNRENKTYATVKLSNPNPKYRGKRGQIVGRYEDGSRWCLEIETVNTTYENGCHTLVGVTYPNGYEKVWFKIDELENFEEYDEKGELK